MKHLFAFPRRHASLQLFSAGRRLYFRKTSVGRSALSGVPRRGKALLANRLAALGTERAGRRATGRRPPRAGDWGDAAHGGDWSKGRHRFLFQTTTCSLRLCVATRAFVVCVVHRLFPEFCVSLKSTDMNAKADTGGGSDPFFSLSSLDSAKRAGKFFFAAGRGNG